MNHKRVARYFTILPDVGKTMYEGMNRIQLKKKRGDVKIKRNFFHVFINCNSYKNTIVTIIIIIHKNAFAGAGIECSINNKNTTLSMYLCKGNTY